MPPLPTIRPHADLHVVGLVASAGDIVRDITIRQKAQALVKQNAQQMRFMLDSSPVAVRISQVAGTRALVFANQAMARLLHTSPEHIMQMHPSECYVHPEDFQRIAARTDRANRCSTPR